MNISTPGWDKISLILVYILSFSLSKEFLNAFTASSIFSHALAGASLPIVASAYFLDSVITMQGTLTMEYLFATSGTFSASHFAKMTS
jgi:hypothetical protein